MGKCKKLNEPEIESIAFIVVNCPLHQVEWREKKQERAIREYAKAHNIKIVQVENTHGFSQSDVNVKFNKIVSLINKKKIESVIVYDLMTISSDIRDAYLKAALIHEAGGKMISVRDKVLKLDLYEEVTNENRK